MIVTPTEQTIVECAPQLRAGIQDLVSPISLRESITMDMCRWFNQHQSDCDYIFAYESGELGDYPLHGCTQHFVDKFGLKFVADFGKKSGERVYGLKLSLFHVFKKDVVWAPL